MSAIKKELKLNKFLKNQLSKKETAKIKGGNGNSENQYHIIIVDEIFD